MLIHIISATCHCREPRLCNDLIGNVSPRLKLIDQKWVNILELKLTVQSFVKIGSPAESKQFDARTENYMYKWSQLKMC